MTKMILNTIDSLLKFWIMYVYIFNIYWVLHSGTYEAGGLHVLALMFGILFSVILIVFYYVPKEEKHYFHKLLHYVLMFFTVIAILIIFINNMTDIFGYNGIRLF